MKIDLTLDRIKMFKSQIRNLWDNVIRFQWSHEDYLKYRREMLDKPECQSLPRWAASELRGYDSALYDQVWRLLDYGYMIDGEMVTIGSATWHKNREKFFDRQREGTLELNTNTGHHIWKDGPGKLWN
jgi:hypothetical protein